MAKKVAVPDESDIESGGIKTKKKRNKCCTCCLIAFIIMLIILVAGFVAGWFLGDKYTKEYFGLTMGDTMGVVNDLYWTKDKDVVKRPFKASDLDGFYSEIKRNVLLKDSAEVDFDTALNEAVNKFLKDDKPSVKANARKAANEGEPEDGESGDGEGGKGEGGGAEGDNNTKGDGDSEIINILVDMIAGALNRNNIDIDRLNSYPEKDEYIFNLKDKQLAAFVNSVLKSVLKNAGDFDALKDVADIVDLSKVVSLKQIRFTAQSQKGEDGEKVIKASFAEVTVWIGLQSAAGQAITKYMNEAGQGWASGVVSRLGDVILPENLYLTMSIPLFGDDNSADIIINDMNVKERKRANKLIDGILKLTGSSDMTLQSLVDKVTEKIKPMLEKAVDKMDFTEAGSGTISMDLLDTVAKMASENMEGELTKSDFLFVLQALLSDQTEQLNSLRPYRFENWYLVNGKEEFLPTGGDEKNKISYDHKFIEEIENKYAIDLGESKNLNEVLEMLGISLDGSNNESSGSVDLLDKINSAKFSTLLDEPDMNKIKLHVTDRMLGAALAGQMDKLTAGADLGDVELNLEALSFVKKADKNKAEHSYALLAVEVDLASMLGSLGGDSLITKLTTGLMPERILLTVTVDITRDRSVKRDEAEFVINSCKNTDRALETLSKLVPDIKLTDISDKISTKLNDMLDQMDSLLDIELAESTFVWSEESGWSGDGASLVMPDVFTVVTNMVLVNELPDGTKERVVTPAELKAVIRDLNNPGVIASNIDAEEGYKAFIGELVEKYYFKADEDSFRDFDDVTEYLSDFSTDKLRVYGKNGLAHDTADTSQLRPVMTGGELGVLLTENTDSNDTVASYEIVRVETGDNTLVVTLAIDLSDLMRGAEQVQKLMTADKLYATVEFKLDTVLKDEDGNPYAYDVGLTINTKNTAGELVPMDAESTYPALLKIVKFFVPEFDIENQVSEFGKILYEQMGSINESIGGTDKIHVFDFTENGLELTDFYTFFALKQKPDLLDNHSPDDIKATLQGMYLVSDDPDEYNPSNYRVSDIMFNEPSPETDPHKPNGTTPWTELEAAALLGQEYVDKDFNGFIKQGIAKIADEITDTGEKGVKVEQTAFLVHGDTANPDDPDDPRREADRVRDWLNTKLALKDSEKVTAEHDYIVVTFSMGMGAFVGGDGEGTNEAKPLFPEKIYITVAYKYDESAADGEKFSLVGDKREADAPTVVFNNMNVDEYDVVVSLMGLDPDATNPDKININNIVGEGVTILNGLSYTETTVAGQKVKAVTIITFKPTTDLSEGMGKVKLELGTVSI